jgi:hypothetical protein
VKSTPHTQRGGRSLLKEDEHEYDERHGHDDGNRLPGLAGQPSNRDSRGPKSKGRWPWRSGLNCGPAGRHGRKITGHTATVIGRLPWRWLRPSPRNCTPKRRTIVPEKLRCSPEIGRAIADALQKGVPLLNACTAAGTTPADMYAWLEKSSGIGAKPLYTTFAAALAVASTELKLACLAAVRSRVCGSQTRAWILYRCFPEDPSANRRFLRALSEAVQESFKTPAEFTCKRR